ncbi:MAG TPA: ABC transporter permease [Candidatus Sulfotelmatobacter sp.]|nr:ABC transporter permease [Candidatus Sulfotelmatobacter sp.]
MRKLRAWFVRLAGFFGGRARAREDFAQEMESHLQMHIEENLRRGLSEDEARRNALMKLGGVAQTQEIYRDRKSLPALESFAQDFRFAGRMLVKNLGFTVTAVLILALGIGANTAMFSVVRAVLLRPLDYSQPDRIVSLASLWKSSGNKGQVSAPDFHDWHDQSNAFEHMALYANYKMPVSVGSGASATAEFPMATAISSEFFECLGIEPGIGRKFTADELKIGGPGAAIVSHGFAVRNFGETQLALGKAVVADGKSLDIVGVMPPGFGFPDKTDIWLTEGIFGEETPSRSAHNYTVVGRLKEGLDLAQAQTQMTAIGARLEEKYPESNKTKSVAVTRLRDALVSDYRLTLLLMLAAVGVVLLIACANLANMLLARAVGRTREIAIRAAIGAGRGRIVRQLITESVVLALVAAFVGVIFAYWGAKTLVALAPQDVPRLSEAGIDGGVLLFALALSLVASLVFGLAPALQVLRVDLNSALKQSVRRAGGGTLADRLRQGLVVAEIALSVILVAGAGLLVKSLIALQNVQLGITPEHIVMAETSVPSVDLDTAKRGARFYAQLLPELRGLPGVRNAGGTTMVPGHTSSNGIYFIDHLPTNFDITGPNAIFTVMTPDAFATMGIPVRSGRDFNDGDTYDAPFTAVINETLARRSFPNEDPIGRTIFCGLDSDKAMKIVGVVGNVRQEGPASEPEAEIYMPYLQHPQPATNLRVIVRTEMEPGVITAAMRERMRAISPDVPAKFTTMEASLSETVAAPRFRTLLLGIFAGLAVCLALAGVYGVMSYVVGQRSNEIGLRMALGASPGEILRLVLRQALVLAGAGILIGFAGAAAVNRLLTSMLFGVKPTDPATYAAVIGIVLAAALLASYIPARRAMRLDPMVALRYE